MRLVRLLGAALLAFITAGVFGGFFGAMLGNEQLMPLIAIALMVPLFFSFLGIFKRFGNRNVS